MTKARDLADLGNKTSLDEINDAYDAGALSNRNLIINGSMAVAQRSTSVAGIGANGTAYHTLDRWQIETGGSNSGRFTMSQSSDAPSGFGSSLKLDCTTADTSIGAGEYLLLEYRLEGQDVQRIKKGTSDAEEITISFYVKANASFNFVLEVLDATNNRACSKLFSTTTGWNRVEITYPADTTGEIVNSNAEGLRLFFWIHAGSTYTSGALNSSSFNSPTSSKRASGISSFYSSTDNEFYLTGFQVEVGDTATPFEHRSYADELAKCQRYYREWGGNSGNERIAVGFYYSTSGFRTCIDLNPEMRTSPTLSVTSHSQFHTEYNGGSAVNTFHGLDQASPKVASVNVTTTRTASGGMAGQLMCNSTAARLKLDAEL